MSGSRTRLVAGTAAVVVAVGAYTGVATGVLPSPSTPAAAVASGTGMGPGVAGMAGSADYMFAVHMVPHHESAVEMAELALERAQRPEVKTLAQDIIRTQTAEIAQLRAAAARLDPNGGSGSAGMGSGMSGMSGDLTQVPAGASFDRAFLEAMIPHHRMGVQMAEMVVRHGSDAQVQALAQDMIEVQTREIALMQGWLDHGYTT
jgi:uncharacterized protein (DUF305 family)